MIIDDSLITCDEIIEEVKTVINNFNEKNMTCKTKYSIFYLPFLLITVALLIAISIYYHLIKSRFKQKHSLPYHKINKLNKIDIKNIYKKSIYIKNIFKEYI